MPVPTSYTEAGLVNFLINDGQLSAVFSALGVTEDNAEVTLADVVIDTLIAMEVDQISEVGAGAIGKLRTLARYYAWIWILSNFTLDADYSADGESFSKDQLFQHAKEMLALWEGRASQYLNVYKVRTSTLRQPNPYTPKPYADRGTLQDYD